MRAPSLAAGAAGAGVVVPGSGGNGAGGGMYFNQGTITLVHATVAENVALGMETPPPMRTLAARIHEVSETYGLPLDPARTVGDLSAGERQRVEIIRCLLLNPKLLILDEPTSVLPPQSVRRLFETLRKAVARGLSVIFISHKLHEVMAISSRVLVLRQGRLVGEIKQQRHPGKSLRRERHS